jgi:POT family proton-dependent oligopeptide transporter
LALPTEGIFFIVSLLLFVAMAFFNPNSSSLIGILYSKNDPGKDSGFFIFFSGINAVAAL